jgi:hypothetical protein
MTTNEPHTTSHSYCEHEMTKSARAACRKARKAEADKLNARLDHIIAELDTKLGGDPLLHMVCRRYSGPRQHDHRDHNCDRDCAQAIANYIDYVKETEAYIVPEAGLRRHAYRMFS